MCQVKWWAAALNFSHCSSCNQVLLRTCAVEKPFVREFFQLITRETTTVADMKAFWARAVKEGIVSARLIALHDEVIDADTLTETTLR